MGEHEREQWVSGYGTMLDVERGSEGAPGGGGGIGGGGGDWSGEPHLRPGCGEAASVPTVLWRCLASFSEFLLFWRLSTASSFLFLI
jgi:hypothetical protein